MELRSLVLWYQIIVKHSFPVYPDLELNPSRPKFREHFLSGTLLYVELALERVERFCRVLRHCARPRALARDMPTVIPLSSTINTGFNQRPSMCCNALPLLRGDGAAPENSAIPAIVFDFPEKR